MIKYVFALILLACLTNFSHAQKIAYSSTQKYQKIRLAVKYPEVTKKIDTKESENVAIVQSPIISNKKQIYGALVEKSKL
jgi:predicted negative regulator of RcsB-dependent stress response